MSKNIQRIQDMLDGNYQTKIQSGYESKTINREVGDEWVDSDGVPWKQMEGYKVKGRLAVSDARHYTHDMNCKDCGQNCNLDKRNKETFVRMDRCFYCQLNFEVDLKSKKFGDDNNLWFFWVKLQNLNRWTAIDKEIAQYMETYWEEGKNLFDKSVVNAIANQNLEGVKYEDIK